MSGASHRICRSVVVAAFACEASANHLDLSVASSKYARAVRECIVAEVAKGRTSITADGPETRLVFTVSVEAEWTFPPSFNEGRN